MSDNTTESNTRKNPFFEPYGTPHDTVPFDRIRFEDFEVRHLPDARRTEWLRANAE